MSRLTLASMAKNDKIPDPESAEADGTQFFCPSDCGENLFLENLSTDELINLLPGMLINRSGQYQWLELSHHAGYADNRRFVNESRWMLHYQNIFLTDIGNPPLSCREAIIDFLRALPGLIKSGKCQVPFDKLKHRQSDYWEYLSSIIIT